MTRQDIIDQTIRTMNQLPMDMAMEISDFAHLISKQHTAQREAERNTPSCSGALGLLEDEEDLYSEIHPYSEADLKEFCCSL